MAEQLICPRCGAPNPPGSASCFNCGWAPSAQPGQPGPADHGGAPAGNDPAYGVNAGPGSQDSGPYGGDQYGGDQYGGDQYGAGGYSTGDYGTGDYGTGDSGTGTYGDSGYGTGGYGTGGYGAGAYESQPDGAGPYAAGGYGSYGSGGYGAGEQRDFGPVGAGLYGPPGGYPDDGDGRGRRRLIVLLAAIGGGLAVIVLAVVLIMNFIRADPQPAVAPPPQHSTAPPAGPSSAAPSAHPSPSATPTPSPSPTPAPDYAKIAGQVKSGVLKVLATGCGDAGTRVGTAFLVGPTTAVASYASLAGARVIAVSDGSDSIPATISSADPQHGIVVLTLDHAAHGHIFALDSTPPRTGDPVGLVAIKAEGRSPALVTSKITGTAATGRVGSTRVSGLAATSTRADDGWAGAPTLAADGKAAGMIFAGPGASSMMIIPGPVIKNAVGDHHRPDPATCDDPLGPDVTMINGKPTDDVRAVLEAYFGGINSGDYRTAYEQLGPDSDNGDFSSYKKGWRSVYDYDITVYRVHGSGDGTRAKVGFTALNLPGLGPKGHASWTCARWTIDYEFVKGGSGLLINKPLNATVAAC